MKVRQKCGSNSCVTGTVNPEKNWILRYSSRIVIMSEIVKCERKKVLIAGVPGEKP